MLANEVGVNTCKINYCEVLTEPGILGFLIKEKYDEINVTKLNFINQLKQKDLISNYYFNFHFNSENSGNIIIGEKPDEYDTKYNSDKYNYFSSKIFMVGNDIDWRLIFDKILYGENELNNQKSIIFRIEFGMIVGDYPWQKTLENVFFNKLINESKCFKETTTEKENYLMYYYCNNNTDLSGFKPFTFFINDFTDNFTLTKDDLFTKEGDKYIFLMVFGKYDLIFGYPFLKKYNMIFNQDLKTIGIYTKKEGNNSKNSFKIYYIIIIILAIILMLLIFIFIYIYMEKRKNQKKEANELSNEENKEEFYNKNEILVHDE